MFIFSLTKSTEGKTKFVGTGETNFLFTKLTFLFVLSSSLGLPTHQLVLQGKK